MLGADRDGKPRSRFRLPEGLSHPEMGQKPKLHSSETAESRPLQLHLRLPSIQERDPQRAPNPGVGALFTHVQRFLRVVFTGEAHLRPMLEA